MRNVTEEIVKQVYEDLLPTAGKVHEGCEVCREDVLVYALNRLPPHYVSTVKGAVLKKLELDSGQGSADVAVALMEGFRFVAVSPRCGREPYL